MAHPNEDVVRRGYDAFATGDMDTLGSLFADDAVWHVQGRNPLAGDYRGVEAILGYFGQSMQLTGGNFSVEVHDVIGNDNHVVGLHRARGERQGRRMDGNSALIFHLSDGKVREVWQMFEDPYENDEFWS